MGVEVVPVWHPTIPQMLTCLTAGECDVGFMGPDPSRAGVDSLIQTNLKGLLVEALNLVLANCKSNPIPSIRKSER